MSEEICVGMFGKQSVGRWVHGRLVGRNQV